ncbi:MAG: RHS repeat-associated core domain-containing protein [Oscillospiraceae bacterium]
MSITDANGNATPQNSIGNINPIRYRSYYFDAETNLYHLNTRYYSPLMCRFLNADGIVGANQDVLGYNLFAYCSNDPVNNCDTTGQGKISNWFKQAVKTVKNWWNGTSNNANHNIIPSSNQIVGVVADSVLGSTINTLNTKTKSQQYGLNSKGTVRGTPWATQPKYPKSTKVANKMYCL